MSGRRDPVASGSAEAAPAWSHARWRCHESRAGRYAAPGILEPPPPLEQVRAGSPSSVVADPAVRERRFRHLAWMVRLPGGPVAKAGPQAGRGTAALPRRWSSPESAVTPGGIPRTLGRRACSRDRVSASAVGRRKEGASLPLAGRRLRSHLRERVKDREPPTSPQRGQ